MASSRLSSLRPNYIVSGGSRNAILGFHLAPRTLRQSIPSGRFSRHHPRRYSAIGTEAPHTPLKPQKSRLRRILTFCAIGVFFSSTGFIMAATPAIASISRMVTPPADEETLTLFSPTDEMTAKIDDFIKNHPLAQELRQNPDYIENRPHMKIPAELRTHSLSAGTLTGPGKIWVPPLSFLHKDGEAIYVLAYLGKDLSGHPGVVHGGCIATLLDEGFARCCFPKLPNKIGMTANLNINYKAPLPVDSFVVLKAQTTKAEGRKAWVQGTLETLVPPGEQGVVHADGTALFVEPKQAAAMARLYPAAS